MPYCVNCGNEVGTQESFCANCGEALSDADSPTQDSTDDATTGQSTDTTTGQSTDTTATPSTEKSKSGVVGVTLIEGEDIIYDVSLPYLGKLVFNIVFGVIFFLFNFTVFPIFEGIPLIIFIVFYIVAAVWDTLRAYTTRYIVTDNRVIIRKGVFNRATKETRYEDVRSITTYSRILERLFGKGSLVLETGGAGSGGITDSLLPGSGVRIQNVGNYNEIADTIRRYIDTKK
jgi:membrane protein YdbS with pleckstrin-like domain